MNKNVAFCHRCENGLAPFACDHSIRKLHIPKAKSVAFTGHRPQSLPGIWNENHPAQRNIRAWLREQIQKSYDEGFRAFYAGGALGVDTWAAELVLEEKMAGKDDMALVIAVPHLEQPKVWRNENTVERYWRIREQADAVHIVTLESYSPKAMFARNNYMVDASHRLLAVWNEVAKGGTYACVQYARRQNNEVIVFVPNKTKIT